MRRRRIVIASVALALGVVAGAIAYTFLASVQRRAYHGAQLTPVYVAAGTIPRGTTAAQAQAAGLIKRSEIPMQFRPASAIASVSSVLSDVAVGAIAQNEILVAGQFASSETTGGTAAQQVPTGDVAISVSVDPVHGVAGLIAPGDKVDLLVQLSTGQKEVTLYQNVPVLAVGSLVAAPNSGATTASATPTNGLITFALPLDAAERVALVESGSGATSGSLYLALVPPGASPSSPPQINSASLMPATPVPS